MKQITLAIIGSNVNAVIFATRARELNIRTVCFGWNNCFDAKELVDVFYITGTFDIDYVIKNCIAENVQGVLCATESALYDTAVIASKLGLICNPVDVVKIVTNKLYMRNIAKNLAIIKMPWYIFRDAGESFNASCIRSYPVIVKPVRGTGKTGITVVESEKALATALHYADTAVRNNDGIMIEEYLASGHEYSVETLSFNGHHQVIQLTSKISSGPPHCIEIEYHQGIGTVNDDMYEKIVRGVGELLDCAGVTFGPCHIEIKIIDDTIYLIELNARMGGGGISYPLTELTTGYPYISAIILCALGICLGPKHSNGTKKFAGIYYVVKQNEYLKKVLDTCDNENWFYKKQIDSAPLVEVTTNYERKNWFMYLSDHKVCF